MQAPAGKYAVGDKIYVTHPSTGQVAQHEITGTGKTFPVKGVDNQYHYLSEGSPVSAPNAPSAAAKVAPENAAAVAALKAMPDITPDPSDKSSVPLDGLYLAGPDWQARLTERGDSAWFFGGANVFTIAYMAFLVVMLPVARSLPALTKGAPPKEGAPVPNE